MVYNIKDRESEIGLSRTVRAVDDTVFDDAILDCERIERIVAVPGKIQFNSVSESTEVFYGKLCKHKRLKYVSAANVRKYLEYP